MLVYYMDMTGKNDDDEVSTVGQVIDLARNSNVDWYLVLHPRQ